MPQCSSSSFSSFGSMKEVQYYLKQTSQETNALCMTTTSEIFKALKKIDAFLPMHVGMSGLLFIGRASRDFYDEGACSYPAWCKLGIGVFQLFGAAWYMQTNPFVEMLVSPELASTLQKICSNTKISHLAGTGTAKYVLMQAQGLNDVTKVKMVCDHGVLDVSARMYVQVCASSDPSSLDPNLKPIGEVACLPSDKAPIYHRVIVMP